MVKSEVREEMEEEEVHTPVVCVWVLASDTNQLFCPPCQAAVRSSGWWHQQHRSGSAPPLCHVWAPAWPAQECPAAHGTPEPAGVRKTDLFHWAMTYDFLFHWAITCDSFCWTWPASALWLLVPPSHDLSLPVPLSHDLPMHCDSLFHWAMTFDSLFHWAMTCSCIVTPFRLYLARLVTGHCHIQLLLAWIICRYQLVWLVCRALFICCITLDPESMLGSWASHCLQHY